MPVLAVDKESDSREGLGECHLYTEQSLSADHFYMDTKKRRSCGSCWRNAAIVYISPLYGEVKAGFSGVWGKVTMNLAKRQPTNLMVTLTS